MWKKLALALGALLLVAAGLFFFWLPGYFEETTNVVTNEPLPELRDDARALHDRLTIVDLHSDTLLWKRDMLDRATRGQVDLPRLEEGNVALQIFSSVTKTPRGQNYDSNAGDTDNITLLAFAQLQPPRTWNSLLERSLWHAEKLHRAEKASDGRLRIVRSRADLAALLEARGKGKDVTGALLSIEGLHDLEGSLGNLDRLYDAGFRMAGLTHFFDNRLAGSMHGEEKGGLTHMGQDAVRWMEAKGMVVDIAHASHPAVADILAMARRPVVSSHGGVQATCRVNRNLTDEEVRGVARTGGVVGIGYWEGAVCDTSPQAIARAIGHVRDLVGIEYVALGSDFDGAVTTRFDTSQLAQVTQALMDSGFSEEDIAAVMGGNAIRVLMQGIEPMGKTPL